MPTVQLADLGATIKTAYEGQPDTNAFTDADVSSLTAINAKVLPEAYIMPVNGAFVFPAIEESGLSFVWPQFWIACDDKNGNGVGGIGNPICSYTQTNLSLTNAFGEWAMNRRDAGGDYFDTWVLTCDAQRTNVETFRLRHQGHDILEFDDAETSMTAFVNVVLDGSIGKILQSWNAARTALINIARVAGGDFIQFGISDAALKGFKWFCGTIGEVLAIDGTTGNGWFVNTFGIGQGAQAQPGKLTVYGQSGEGAEGQTMRLGQSAGVDYRLARNLGTGTLEIEGSQVGAIGYKFMSGSMAIGQTDALASAKLDVQSTTQGLLPPRMTTTQKNAINAPAEGLMVYDITLHKLCVRGVSGWETITSS